MAGTKQNVPDSKSHGTLVEQPSPEVCSIRRVACVEELGNGTHVGGAPWLPYLQRLAAVSESCAAASNQGRPHRRLDVPVNPFPQLFSFLKFS